jgi:hypothetical protein
MPDFVDCVEFFDFVERSILRASPLAALAPRAAVW